MRKVSLDVSELRVESFETESAVKERGTVHGYLSQFTCPRTQCGEECPSGPQSCFPTEAFTDGQIACYCNGTQDCSN